MTLRTAFWGIALFCLLLLSPSPVSPSQPVAAPALERPPAVAGQFYPGDRSTLRLGIEAYLDQARPPSGERPLALIAPHAGYHYSGQIAADAWRQAMEFKFDLVVILGANHSGPPFNGVSVFLGSGYRTPLGLASIDREIATALAGADQAFAYRPEVHSREHSIEVHVPFVQTIFPEAKIVTAIVGSPELELCSRFGKALARLIKKHRALIVASSDLSHYPAYEDAVTADHATLRAMARLDPAALASTTRRILERKPENLVTCACGKAPVLAGMAATLALGATRARVISYANSGDVSIGDPDRVVGYGAVAIFKGGGKSDTRVLKVPPAAPATTPLTADERAALLAFARSTIEQWLDTGTLRLARDFTPTLWRKQRVFVTLRKDGALRGCIGHLVADRPMCQTVGAMALQAAFNDRRFSPVQADEMKAIEIEISLLTPLVRIGSVEELELGRDGIKLVKDGRSAVYLPEVAAEQGWTREETMQHLCRKAGLGPDAWRDGAELYKFESIVFSESDGHPPDS